MGPAWRPNQEPPAALGAPAANGAAAPRTTPTEIPADEPCVFPDLTAWSADYRALSQDARRRLRVERHSPDRLARASAARGFSEEIIGRVLNHAKHTVTARHYIRHAYLAETRQALDAWDREVAAIISGDESSLA